jgi:hypothetical protein
VVEQGTELVKRFFVRAGALALLFYASCGGRTTLVDISEHVAGEGGVGGSNGGKGGKGGNGGNGGKGSGGSAGTGAGGSTGGVGPAGTGGVNWCQPNNPCVNGGVCYSIPEGWVCNCPAGTFGRDCSGNVDDCSPSPCVNGKCEDRVNGFNCDCDDGFTGELCELAVNGCEPNPCKNGGKCLLLEDEDIDCECPDGWRGRRCEVPDEPCDPNPCQNGGVCSEIDGDFSCACPSGYTGKRCQTKPNGDCPSPDPCQNGGTCVPLGGGEFTCDCPTGFELPLCQCRGDDEPQGDGSCALRTVCGLANPEAFGSGACSNNTAEFADWWCQLGGYAEAASYEAISSGVLNSLYYVGGAEEVLSSCSQVIGPASYGYQSACTGVSALTCTGRVDNSLRSILMACGNPARDPQTFIPADAELSTQSGCAPVANTQALLVTRNGVASVAGPTLRSYLQGGGIVISEYSISDELWSKVFPDVSQSGLQLGSCLDNVPTIVQFSGSDPFWIDNPFPMLSQAQTGCGYSIGHFPYIVPLAGWDFSNVGLGYRDLGQGRFWAADFDWQDQDQNDAMLPTLLGYMITHRR